MGAITFRVLGSKYGTVVMAIDMLKGMAAVGCIIFFPITSVMNWTTQTFMIGLGSAAVVGHIFPILQTSKEVKVWLLFLEWCWLFNIVTISCVDVSSSLYLTRYVSIAPYSKKDVLRFPFFGSWNEHEVMYRVCSAGLLSSLSSPTRKTSARLR